MITRVYALIYDDVSERFLFNRKDGLLPPKLAAFEGLIGLFGGKIEKGEGALEALIRELDEEIPGISFNLESLRSLIVPISEDDDARIFFIPYDLSGDNKSAPSVHEIRIAVCKGGEGEPMLVTNRWLSRQPQEAFAPGVYSVYKNFLLS